VCGIPFEIYLFVRLLLQPGGFWQNLVLFGVVAYFLAVIQFVLLIMLFFLDSDGLE